MKTSIHSNVIVAGLTFSLVLAAATPSALAGLNVNVNGNGTSSDNTASIQINNNARTEQNNDVSVKNKVNTDATTGKNTVSKNVGDAHIDTGDISNSINANNQAGTNSASGTACCTGDLSIGVKNNGAHSDSEVSVNAHNNNSLNQNNNGSIENDVRTDLNTGDNASKKNVGDSHIKTGDIDAQVALNNAYGANNFEGEFTCCDLNGNIVVRGNGAYADVNINVALENISEYFQNNDFWVKNDVDQKHNTGGNDCEENVGDCHIETGDITSGVDVDNQGGGNNIGGVVDQDDDKDPDDPNGGQDGDDKDDDDSIIDDIVDKFFPEVKASTDEDLGATELPMTGFGDMPFVSWMEVALAAYLLVVGLYLRRIFGSLERRFNRNVRI